MFGFDEALAPKQLICCAIAWLILALSLTSPAQSQSKSPKIRVEKRETLKGVVTEVKVGEISFKTDDGQTIRCKIQDQSDRAVSIGGTPFRLPAKISLAGQVAANLVERGMVVQFDGRCSINGKAFDELKQINIVADDKAPKLKVDYLTRPDKTSAPADVTVVGRVINLASNNLQIEVPKGRWARNGRMTFKLADDAVLDLNDHSLARVVPGDTVVNARVIVFNNGERVTEQIEIRPTGDRDSLTQSFDGQLENRFRHLSNEPGIPRELRSPHFVLNTDLSDRSGNVLLAKLETMYELVGGYYRDRPRTPIVCFVVRDLRQWPPGRLERVGIDYIAKGAGVTSTRSRGGRTEATVYSCADHSVAQHEAVHAFCGKTFGSTGPTWYSEGMAEMGQYWKPDTKAVQIDAIVVNYLANSPKKKLREIVAANQITGDSWQAYAWRWAICHLLANNPNYARRFKTLGLNLMSKKDDSFDQAFGKIGDKISFEYDQFVQNFGNGYRVDLCVWDWKTRASNLGGSERLKHKIAAQAGWQATKLMAKPGAEYEFVCQGKWNLNPSEQVNADGNPAGQGRLIGVWFNDYQLSEPFELGAKGSFVAEGEGQLYVRCRDGWTSLADNEGEITLFLRRAKKKQEEPQPEDEK